MTDHSTPQTVVSRLAAIEDDLAERQNSYETAASDRARLTRDWDKRLAICHVEVTGPNSDTRKAKALIRAIEQDDMYDRLMDAEARYEAAKVVERVLTTRSAIGMSILKSQGRA